MSVQFERSIPLFCCHVICENHGPIRLTCLSAGRNSCQMRPDIMIGQSAVTKRMAQDVMEFTEYLDLIERKLFSSFNIWRDQPVDQEIFDLYAEYHLRNEKYIATKKAVIYAIESNEYCLIKRLADPSLHRFNDLIDLIKASLTDMVKPDQDHMSSIVTVVFVLDTSAGPDVQAMIEAVKRFKYHKGFAFGLRGWADIRLVLVSLEEGVLATNKKGKDVKKVYQF